MDIYYTVCHSGEGKYVEKMSRFLSFAYPVNDAESARMRVKELQNSYHDARHVCWAYMIGPERTEYQANDNGEPSGTGGRPILGQINSMGLTDVVVAVVRYFGGVKLGTGPLAAAYREAARLALEDAGVKECHAMGELSVTFPYMAADGVMKIVKTDGIETMERIFGNTCTLRIRLRLDMLEEVAGRLAKLDGVMIEK